MIQDTFNTLRFKNIPRKMAITIFILKQEFLESFLIGKI